MIGEIFEHKCEKCGRLFYHSLKVIKLCFDCTVNEIQRLRDQDERIENLLNDFPEIAELLSKLTPKQILNRLKGKEEVDFT